MTDALLARFRVLGSALGFEPPPVPLRLSLLPVATRGAWSLYVAAGNEANAASVLSWLGRTAPNRVDFGPFGVLRAEFLSLPERWRVICPDEGFRMIHLAPDGLAIVTLLAPRAALKQFAQRAQGSDPRAEAIQTAPRGRSPEDPTPAQHAALTLAVAEGYYQIPRLLNLHQLAAKMGITASSLSERLRRGEGVVITAYVRAADLSPVRAFADDGFLRFLADVSDPVDPAPTGRAASEES